MTRNMLAAGLLAFLALLPSGASAQGAPKPLYRDPVHDGAADVSIAYDRAQRQWLMFYTNRRADLKLPDPQDVAWVHATAIGIAASKDGLHWAYQGTAQFPAACTGPTLWAPEVYAENGTYHMWLTIVPGIFHRWSLPQATSKIVHLTSPDLRNWSCQDTLDLGSTRVIDASVIRIGDRYHLWYKDERAKSRILSVESTDLKNWKKTGGPVADMSAEGPKVFRFQNRLWMIVDDWKGMALFHSPDGVSWTRQDGPVLATFGTHATDRGLGQHPDVVVSGEGANQRAFLYYFVHQGEEPQAKADPSWRQRTVIQMGELKFDQGRLTVDRNAMVTTPLVPPRP